MQGVFFWRRIFVLDGKWEDVGRDFGKRELYDVCSL
jgi:hypothetical protein